MEHYLHIGHFYKHSTLVSNVIQSCDVCSVTHTGTDVLPMVTCLLYGIRSSADKGKVQRLSLLLVSQDD